MRILWYAGAPDVCHSRRACSAFSRQTACPSGAWWTPRFVTECNKRIPFCGRSLEAAVATYEEAGGSANIFINDDGLQLMDPEAQLRRIRFYRQHNIGCAPLSHIFCNTMPG